MKANHQTEMEESVIADVVIEKDIRSIMADSIRNIPVTADEIRHESAKGHVIRKSHELPLKKMAYNTGSKRINEPVQTLKDLLCY